MKRNKQQQRSVGLPKLPPLEDVIKGMQGSLPSSVHSSGEYFLPDALSNMDGTLNWVPVSKKVYDARISKALRDPNDKLHMYALSGNRSDVANDLNLDQMLKDFITNAKADLVESQRTNEEILRLNAQARELRAQQLRESISENYLVVATHPNYGNFARSWCPWFPVIDVSFSYDDLMDYKPLLDWFNFSKPSPRIHIFNFEDVLLRPIMRATKGNDETGLMFFTGPDFVPGLSYELATRLPGFPNKRVIGLTGDYKSCIPKDLQEFVDSLNSISK